jgi:hypothetical protein
VYRLIRRCALVALAGLLGGPGCTTPQSPESARFDFGPIASRRVDALGEVRLRGLGPLLEWSEGEDERRFAAVRPFYSRVEDPATERWRSDVLWPVGYTKRFKDEVSGRFLTALWTRFDVEDPASRYRFWILPFYFQGRDAEGDGYVGVFPLGGRIHEFLGRDRITFWLFPLYLKMELNEMESHSLFWPIYSETRGDGLYRFRVFPFYGQNRLEGRFNKKFVLWPFWTSAEYFYPGSSGKGFVLFPLYGQLKLDDQRSWMVLPPFFRVARGGRVNMALLPWPFIQRRTGEIDQVTVWPLYGQKRMRGVESRFFAWPLIWQERIDQADARVVRRYALPVYYAERKREQVTTTALDPNTPVPRGELTANYQKLWPLLSYRREGDTARFRMLDLWPLKQTGGIERNYAPLWSLLQYTRHGEATDTELLWGLYRRERRGEEQVYTSLFPLVDWGRDERDAEVPRRHWALLKGLLGYERQGTNKHLRLLYVLRVPLGSDLGSVSGVESGADAESGSGD